jgi:DNA-binding CsgD family transcriptional regulator
MAVSGTLRCQGFLAYGYDGQLEGAELTVIPEPGTRTRRERGLSSRPLLDREAELSALTAVVEVARGGDGRLVVVEGPAGIGKTRLLAEGRLLASEFEVLSARAGELESGFAFGVVRQLFEGTLAAAPSDVRAELLSGAAALAAPLFAVAPGDSRATGIETSFAMLHGLYWLAVNFAQRRPTLLVVDDLHWADDPSLRWLGYLARRLEGLPLLVIAATRAPEQAHTPALVTEIVADPLAVVVRPAALSQASTAALARVLGLEPDEVFAGALRDASAGNPLYLAAILDAVARQQIEPTAEQAPRLLELGGEALARGVALRLSRLPVEAVALVRAAAILGDRAELSLAASLAALDKTVALDAFSALVHTDLLERDGPLAFRHPVIRSAILEDMSAGERMRLHRRAAELLLESGAHPEQAATYLISTIPDGDPFVVSTLRLAARNSTFQGAPDAATTYLRRALDEPPSPRERPEVLAELGAAEIARFDARSAAEHLSEALAEIDDITERPDLVLAYVSAGLPLSDRAAEAIDLLTQVSARGYAADLRERIEAHLIIAAMFDGALYPIAREYWDTASARDRDEPIRSGVLLGAGAGQEARRGIDRPRAVELARRAVAGPVRDARERFYGLNTIYSLTLAGEVEDAEAALRDAIEDARRAGDRFAFAAYHVWRGLLRVEQGRLLAAEEDLQMQEVLSMAALPIPLAYRAACLAELRIPRGQHAQAELALADVHLDEVQPGHKILFLCARGRLYLETGRPELALTDFRQAAEIAASIDMENPAFCPWRSQAALALHRLGRVDEALALARDELELSRRWGAPRTIGISMRAVGLVEGGASGGELLRGAVEVLAGSPARLEHARALIDLGAALRRANNRTEARTYLREGIDLAHQCGATALVDRGNNELAATGARARSVMLSGLESLTASERRVAQMAAEEVSNKEIAQALFVTVKTVEMHLSRVYRKLDIESRRQLAGALSAPAVKTAASS